MITFSCEVALNPGVLNPNAPLFLACLFSIRLPLSFSHSGRFNLFHDALNGIACQTRTVNTMVKGVNAMVA
jgi:hypothetical protein